MKKIISRIARVMSITAISLATCMSGLFIPVVAESSATAGSLYTDEDGNYYYEPLEQGTYSNGGYTLTKVSHSTSGAGITDGIIDDDTSAGQSYSWSMEEEGDYVYIGTCYNSTYYIYYNKISSSLTTMKENGTISSDINVSDTTKEILRVMFGTDSFDSEVYSPMSWDPVIMAVNKKTGEAKVIFRESEIRKDHSEMFINGINALSGYRMAIKYNGKIYFAGMGSPTATLVEVDPTTNDAQIVYYNKNITSAAIKEAYGSVSCGVHGLIVYDNEILMCLATDDLSKFDKTADAKPGAIIVGSSDPSASLSSWRTVATSKDFDDLPAVMQIDGLNGGGIWDIIEYNGKIYVTVVTDKTDKTTNVTNKQGFALYSGTKQEDGSFTWEQIAGDHGELPFGFGISYSMSCNMWTYNGYLYFGTYNDPMIDLMSVATSGDFEDLYNDLDHSIYLYRMDSEGNFEQVGGKNDNPYFPNGSIGNLGTGLGNNSNQYCWRFGEHDGELYIGTYDTSTLTYMFTQLTDGQVSTMSDEQMQARASELETALFNALNTDNELLKQFLSKTISSNLTQTIFKKLSGGVTNLTKDWNPVPDYVQGLKDYESFKDLINEKIDSISLADSDSGNTDLTELINETLSEDETGELGISIDDYLESLDEQDLVDLYTYAYPDEATEATSLLDGTDEARFTSIKDKLKTKLKELVSSLFEETDKIFYNQDLHNYVYYFGTNYYAQSCEKGFDLLVSNDGVNFDAITRNGFGDETNHGLRTICSTDSGLYMGTANPFHATQLWKLTTQNDVEPTASPTTEPTSSPTAEPTTTPTSEPTASPTAEPTSSPTTEPTVEPTVSPTVAPSVEPTSEPTTSPTVEPTSEPTTTPTVAPTTDGSTDTNNGGNGTTTTDSNAVATTTTNNATVATTTTNGTRARITNRTNTNTNTTVDNTDSTATASPEATVEPTSTPSSTSTPTTIKDDETPEASPSTHWSIVNLVIGLLSVLFGVIVIASSNDDSDSKRSLICKIVAGVSAAAAVVTFVLTQHLTGSMVLVDAWTIMMAVCGITSIASFVLTKHNIVDEESSEEE